MRVPGALLVPLVVLGLGAGAREVRADSFDLGDVDKRAHMAVSYGLTLSVAVILRKYEVPRWQALAIAAAATIVVGTTKELVDDEYSWGDQLANGIGVTSATIIVLSFQL